MWESQLKIGNREYPIMDTLFPTLCSETKQPCRGGFGVWEIRVTPQIECIFINKYSTPESINSR